MKTNEDRDISRILGDSLKLVDFNFRFFLSLFVTERQKERKFHFLFKFFLLVRSKSPQKRFSIFFVFFHFNKFCCTILSHNRCVIFHQFDCKRRFHAEKYETSLTYATKSLTNHRTNQTKYGERKKWYTITKKKKKKEKKCKKNRFQVVEKYVLFYFISFGIILCFYFNCEGQK